MEQKVISVGNSLAVVIPQLIRKQTGLKAGDGIVIGVKGKQITVSSVPKKSLGVDIKFIKILDEFINDHKDVLQKLANR